MAAEPEEGSSTSKSSSTTVNIVNCAQVVHISGDNNTVTIPNARILVNQQATGINPTIGVNVPGSASSAGNGQPNRSFSPVGSHHSSHQMPTLENGPAAADVSQSNTRTCIRYAEGSYGVRGGRGRGHYLRLGCSTDNIIWLAILGRSSVSLQMLSPWAVALAL